MKSSIYLQIGAKKGWNELWARITNNPSESVLYCNISCPTSSLPGFICRSLLENEKDSDAWWLITLIRNRRFESEYEFKK